MRCRSLSFWGLVCGLLCAQICPGEPTYGLNSGLRATDAYCRATMSGESNLSTLYLQRSEQQVIVIVDAYSSGNLLAPELAALGYRIVHIRSGLQINDRLKSSWQRDDFAADYDSRGSVERARRYLLGQNVALVIPGAESGVTFAENLAATVGTPTNLYSLIEARRNKRAMIETLRGSEFEAEGVFVPPQLYTDNYQLAASWVKRELGEWATVDSVIVKPLLGAASHQVHRCHSDGDLKVAIADIMACPDHYGQKNEGALIQKRIVGKEYAINGAVVWHNGELHIRVTDAWFYNKIRNNGDAPMYGYEELIPFSQLPKQTMRFLRKVLTGLGYRRGAFHLEVIVEEGTGRMYLMEVGARLYGAGNPRIAGSVTEYGQVQATIDSYFHPEEFLKRAGKPYQMRRHAAVFNVSAPDTSRTLYVSHRKIPELREILGESLFEILSFYGDGRKLAPHELGKDLGSVIFQIELAHTDRQLISKHIRTLEDWKQKGYFWRFSR